MGGKKKVYNEKCVADQAPVFSFATGVYMPTIAITNKNVVASPRSSPDGKLSELSIFTVSF